MKKCKSIIFIIAAVIAITCKHRPEVPVCIAGSGGNVTIVVYAKYDTSFITNYFTHFDTAFVKFGTTISPGTNPAFYDTLFVGDPRENHIHCFGLKCGDYFVFRTAWDSVANVRRYGGSAISFTVTSGEERLDVIVN